MAIGGNTPAEKLAAEAQAACVGRAAVVSLMDLLAGWSDAG